MKCGLSYLPLPHCLLSPATQPGPGVYDVAVVFCWGGGLVAVTSLSRPLLLGLDAPFGFCHLCQ